MLAQIISEDSGISVGVIVIVGTVIVGVVGWAATQLAGIRKSITGVVGEVKSLRSDLVKLEAGQWSKADASEWALRAKILNTALRLPDPRNPQNIIGEMHE